MREIDAIVAEYNKLKHAQISCVLATVVHVQGSSYRRAGARMLVDEFGNLTGAISGGCLEGDALRKALHAMHQQKNKLVTYDTSDENNAVIGAQLGCNGIIKVLFEAIDFENERNACELLQTASKTEEKASILIEFDLKETNLQPGTVALIYSEDKIFASAEIEQVILFEASEVIQNKRSDFLKLERNGNSCMNYIQFYEPPIKLVLVGAGNDAMILASQAELLGWKIIIADGRPTHANTNRFSSGCQVIVTRPEDTLEKIEIDERTCFALMSHNYHYDLAVLQLLLKKTEVPYIGILGPLKKWERMKDDLDHAGIEVSSFDDDRIHAPIGLDLGAETPAEIGLSILAEIQAKLTNSSAKSLKFKNAPIHERRTSEIPSI
ncbi:XdhC family protein [uncultured Christiangramia sp.]|uniref:XdhC family protein n=1 Tax=uncultured Christiangramia sp. TaxID=503836 RepID=UPI002638DC90|nr:XdhC/CoxI family protein [uncultured Christiangramia sp.]